MKQVLYFLSLGVFLHSCKSKETVTPNRPPSAFTVTPTLKSDGKTIVLNWTKAKDPDGDAVTYTVVLKDTLVKNISDTTYTIASLDFNYSQPGKVIAKDVKGLMSEASFTATTKAVTFVNIPDANFEKFLIYRKIDKDSIVNGRMNIDDAKGVKEINISRYGIIKSIAGIEAFTDIQYLNCYFNQIKDLDISKNINLQTLYCDNNQLKDLDISKNINLQTLYCSDNQLKDLDVSKNINLQNLSCGHNQLKELDISKNVNLQDLYCGYNPFTVLDVSKNINLQNLSCGDNQLKDLDVSKNINLQFLTCPYTQLKSLDVSKNINLQTLWCVGNPLTNLDVSKNINLQILNCFHSQLTNLDVSKNINLRILNCNNNQLTTLNISKGIYLQTLNCRNNQNLKTICVADVAKVNANTNWQKDPTATYEVCK